MRPACSGSAGEALDLHAMQKEPARAFGLVLLVAGLQIRLDVAVEEIELPFFRCGQSDPCKLTKPGTDGFDLRALEFDSRLELFEDDGNREGPCGLL